VLTFVKRLACSILFITMVAFALRVSFVIDQARKIPPLALASVPFENEVGNVAAALAKGDGFCCLFRQPSGPTAWLVPVYPALVAAIFKVFGTFTVKAFYAAALMNSLFSALACVPLFYVGRRVGGLVVSAVAAWLWAFFPSGILLPFEWIWDTSLSALLAATLLWATLYVAESSRRRDAVAYGLLWGLALLTNPALGAALPFFLGWIAYRWRGASSVVAASARRRSLVVIVGVIAAVCLPWTIRNTVQFHRLIPMRANLAFELWMGNNEIFDEHSRAINRISRFEEIHRYDELGETAFLDDKWHKAHDFIRAHPALFLQLTGRRMIAMWMGTASPWSDFLRTDSLLVRFLFFWNGVALVGLLAGLVRLILQRSQYLFPLAVIPVAFPIVYYFTQSSLRLRHPCDPILALFLAIAVTVGVRPAAETRPVSG